MNIKIKRCLSQSGRKLYFIELDKINQPEEFSKKVGVRNLFYTLKDLKKDFNIYNIKKSDQVWAINSKNKKIWMQEYIAEIDII